MARTRRQQLWSSVGGLTTQARHDSTTITTPARHAANVALDKKLLAEIDPDDKLSEDERIVRLARARQAYFRALALRRHR